MFQPISTCFDSIILPIFLPSILSTIEDLCGGHFSLHLCLRVYAVKLMCLPILNAIPFCTGPTRESVLILLGPVLNFAKFYMFLHGVIFCFGWRLRVFN
jgi:hypothetical protein